MSTCTTFCWTRQLSNTTSIGPVAFEGRELCAVVLHSAGPDSYLTLSPPFLMGTVLLFFVFYFVFNLQVIQVQITSVL
jgi:hypothetical protein